jgi:mannose-6-phosphate isomerase-like protein (cupin superfamily)
MGFMKMKGYKIVSAREIKDFYEDTDVPGEFRRLTRALDAKQLGITLIHIPPHSDFEQGTGHYHEKIEELYIITSGTLTMRFGGEIVQVPAGSVVKVVQRRKK